MKFLTIILAACCLTAACATPPPVSVDESLAAGVNEQMLWRRALEEQRVIDTSGWLYQDVALEAYLNSIAARLDSFTHSPDITFNIKIINDPNLNAFAFPNGVIYVHTGVLARMENEAQLAALLAHEMTHSTNRHSLRVLKSLKNRPGNMVILGQSVAKTPMIRDLARLLGANGSTAAVAGYTRELEIEADRDGLDLMAKAGYDPRQALNLFEHLRQEIEIAGIQESFFLGTHPSVQQRIDNVNHWLAAEYSEKDGGLINTANFRNKLDRLILDNARLDLQFGRFDIARRSVEKYLLRNPNDAGAYYLLGEISRQHGRPEDLKNAIKHYEKAIALDPSFAAPHKAMGLMHFKKGQQRLARKFFETCLLLSPDAPDKDYIQDYLQKCINHGEES